MDFLRRLHPSAAAQPDAARLVPPVWGGVATPSPVQAAIAGASPARLDERDPGPRPVPGAMQARPVTAGHRARRSTPEETTADAPEPARRPTQPLAVEPPRAATKSDDRQNAHAPPRTGAWPAPAPFPSPLSAPPPAPRPAVSTRVARSGPQAQSSTDATASVRPAATPTPGLPAGRPLAGPLRVESLRDVVREAASAPVVHVTIDRIDVRLPPAPAPAARAPTRPRTASGVPSLGDYLRPGNGSGR